MSDYNSGLPIRSEADSTDERVHVKIVDGTNPAVNQVRVDSDNNLHTESHGNDPAGTDRVMRTSEQGHVSIDGLYHASNNTDPSNMGLVAHTRATSPADSDQTKRLTAITSSTVHALDIALHDESGANYSDTNPLPVTVVDNEGTEVNDYSTAAAVAAAATSNHDYTVTAGKTLKLTQVEATASGKAKIEVQVESGVASGVFATKWVMFNSTAETNMSLKIQEPVTVLAGVRVRVIRTNKDNQAQDLYSTVSGHEI